MRPSYFVLPLRGVSGVTTIVSLIKPLQDRAVRLGIVFSMFINKFRFMWGTLPQRLMGQRRN